MRENFTSRLVLMDDSKTKEPKAKNTAKFFMKQQGRRPYSRKLFYWGY